MIKNKFFGKGSILLSFLFCFFLVGCTSYPGGRRWILERAVTPYAQYDAVRLYLPVDCDYRGLELVIVRGTKGICMFLNSRSVPFPIDGGPPDQTDVVFQIADSFYIFQADRLKGGQRLLLSCEAAQRVIEALSVGCPVYISVGRYYAEVIPDFFPQLYSQLSMELPK